MRQRDEPGNVASDSKCRKGRNESPSASLLHAIVYAEPDSHEKRRYEEDELEDGDTCAVRYAHSEILAD